jgi:imidazolonepropionase-like amidohydrolase
MHQDLYLLVHKVGMTPEEALRSATSLTAKRFRFEDRGRLEEGLNADLLLVKGTPLENIDDTMNIRGVWREGHLCSVYADNMEK